ncbi:hypothetical protein GTS_34780 [Gandjariella thermophila]|uniref:Uncharacterized protein n=1 Tax=Gandjariella thermophila TaxID=1931992 RepID=A0A4D4J586_9PSEU|nr:hypothetical protein GTS_34780 [Gandjariella thermophila]
MDRDVALVICLPQSGRVVGGSGHEKTPVGRLGPYEGRASTQSLSLGVDAPTKYEDELALHDADGSAIGSAASIVRDTTPEAWTRPGDGGCTHPGLSPRARAGRTGRGGDATMGAWKPSPPPPRNPPAAGSRRPRPPPR